MIILNRPQTDPYFNIAAEEYFVKNKKEPIFMLWQNTASVVVGKHQNALKEINLNYLNEKNIPVIRRISGGGTVYHDLGNINYSFIDNGNRESLVNFKKYSQPILDVLISLGINARLVGKSDLKIGELKFSGNASHVYKNTVLHHGTLLFSSDLNILETSIMAKTEKFEDKAVQSKRSLVTNIENHLQKPIAINEFKNLIIMHILDEFPDCTQRDLNENEIKDIDQLANEKYKSWEWNFGYSPSYYFSGRIENQTEPVIFQLQVRNGVIAKCDFHSSQINDINVLNSLFIGKQHNTNALREIYQLNSELFKTLKIEYLTLQKAFFS